MDRDWFHLARDPALGIEGLQAKLDTYAYGRHAHETYAIGVCEVGSQTFTCRRTRQRTRRGSVILFEPFELHDGHATTGDGVVYRMLYLPHARLRRALEHEDIHVDPAFPDTVVDDPVLARAVTALGRALALSCDALATAERHVELVAAIARAVGRPPDPARLSRHPDAIARVRDLLYARIAEPVTIDELSRCAGLSRFRMLRAFQRQIGVAPSIYRRTLRLEWAKRRLAAGEAPAAVAAAPSALSTRAI